MREILFRGKTKQGCWEYGFFDYNVAENDFIIHVVADTPPTLGDPGGDVFSERYQVIPETVGQFTGLTDKNGKKIFEGDLVKIEHPCWHAKCKVKFIDGAFFFCELDNPVQNAWIRQDKFMGEQWKIKAIGNIHDNPELLNEN